ncbi:MAG TPA: NAD(P)H-dependent oxidoreductase subunit E, partial [Gammaproteobacteria bacterium]|nr:NAD(P)H-dependent oxidoreductase subunit E [Gammaproteobacteria bacterium]
MRLLKALMALQAARGEVGDADLEELARSEGVPLHRLEGLRSFYPIFRRQAGAPVQVQVCRDAVCRMAGGSGHCRNIQDALHRRADIEVTEVSCLGLCDQAPAAMINHQPVSGTVDEIRDYALGVRQPLTAATTMRRWPSDPYAAVGARYGALRTLLTDGDPDAVVQALKDAGLRGLGGAAFPAGMKWELTRRAVGAEKYVICNADESEPGTFKDRVLLE